ncbi:hypothetical protein Ddc_19608 [Ditylenchus destructor]|nr:hypothetical protein Ddc_19608 [Ditylenchus destructor]
MPLPLARISAPTTMPNLSSVRLTNPPAPVIPQTWSIFRSSSRRTNLTSNDANLVLRTNVETQSATGNITQKDSAPQFSSINDSNSASRNIGDREPVACRQEFDLHDAQKKVANELVLQTLRHNN